MCLEALIVGGRLITHWVNNFQQQATELSFLSLVRTSSRYVLSSIPDKRVHLLLSVDCELLTI